MPGGGSSARPVRDFPGKDRARVQEDAEVLGGAVQPDLHVL